MTLREYTARENMRELALTGECGGLARAFIAKEAKVLKLERLMPLQGKIYSWPRNR